MCNGQFHCIDFAEVLSFVFFGQTRMINLFLSFFSLYLATLLMSLGTGLYNTFIALHLTQEGVSQVWIGLLIAAFYTGQVLGARFGHKLVQQVGHIRAYAISAAMVTVLVLAQTITPLLPVWVFLRFLTGATMVTQYMVLESWLNDQADQKQRGSVFAFYMVMSGLGLVVGQMTVSFFSPEDLTTLNVVAMSMALCLIPVAITRRSHPTLQAHTPIKLKVFIRLVPMSMFVLFVAGSITGSFYGLGPVYASKEGMNTDQVALFLSVSVMAGLLSQWPMGWLSDRIYRLNMIRFNALLLGLLTIPLYGYWHLPYPLMLVLVAIFGVLQFTIYPLATAFANEHVDPSLRVGLSGVLLMTYGVGASLGPLLVGKLMDVGGAHMFYIYTSLAAFSLVIFVRKEKVKGTYKVDPEPFVPMSVSVPASPVATVMDPRVDESIDISADAEAMDKVLDIIQAGDPISELNLPHKTDADHTVADEDLALAGEEAAEEAGAEPGGAQQTASQMSDLEPVPPTPDTPTPDTPTPDTPTPDMPTPDMPTPDMPTPDMPKR